MAIGGMVEWNSGKALHRANNARPSSRSEIAKRACYPDGTRLAIEEPHGSSMGLCRQRGGIGVPGGHQSEFPLALDRQWQCRGRSGTTSRMYLS
jgi:hypothetical protein